MKEKRERRNAYRKTTESISVEDITLTNHFNIIAKLGRIVTASTNSFLMEIRRDQIVPKELKTSLNLDALLGETVVLFLPQMNLDLDGKIIKTRHVGKGSFEIVVAFSEDIPEYWRECLVDLLPEPGELD
jgi:hypothetical protein